MAAVYIKVSSVSKDFVTLTGDTIHAIKNVTFEVNAGEFVTIVGPSGCGKSTLLRLIAGLLKPTKGEISIDGKQVRGPIKGASFVFQKPVLFDWYKVIDNVLAPIRLVGLKTKDYFDKARELLSLVKLDGFSNKYPNELSGGMQQRVAIARALILDPKLMIMDEPFGALDALTRDQLNFELLKIWRENKMPILFVTHDIQEAVLLGDKVIVFSARPGRIKNIISVELNRPRSIETKSDRTFGETVVKIYNLITMDE